MLSEYTTKQVADLLNVSESSVKRWCDRGLIECQKTGGGHRRITRDALAAFLEQSSQWAASGEHLPTRLKIFDAPFVRTPPNGKEHDEQTDRPDWIQSQRDKLNEALLEGDEVQVRKLITQHFTIHESVALVADELLAPCFLEIGKSWVSGKTDVYQERRAVGLTHQILLEVRRLLPAATSGRIALGCSLAGDDYLLPTTIVEMVLRQCGIAAHNLGTNIPFPNLTKAVLMNRPSIVWMSISHIEDRDDFASGLDQFMRSIPNECSVLVGGRLAHWVEPSYEGRLHQFANMRKLESFLIDNQSNNNRFRLP